MKEALDLVLKRKNKAIFVVDKNKKWKGSINIQFN